MPQKTTSFRNSLEKTLKKYSDVAWLGQKSPLASPYFLGLWLDANISKTPSHAELGRVLQRLLCEAMELITDKERERYQLILTEYYFHGLSVEVAGAKVGLGRDAFNTNRKRSIIALEQALISLLRPSLRLEQQPFIEHLFGYESDIESCQRAIQDRQSVAIIGNVGSGKTAFGSFVSQQHETARVFWYTIRPGLNTRQNALLFALGYFFHSCGSSALWLQLVADGEKIQHKLIPGLLNFTIDQFRDSLPTLCFDQVDLLHPIENSEHAAIVALIESLQGLLPIVLMGQQVPVETDSTFSLTKIPLAALTEWLTFKKLSFSLDAIKKIYSYTHGNPRLIELFISLASTAQDKTVSKSNFDIDSLLPQLAANRSIDHMLHRILSQISQIEHRILMELSVFRESAPAEVWMDTTENAFALNRIIGWNLAYSDQKGGVAIVPIYRPIVYQSLSPEVRELLHDNAAQIRAERGTYTAAAYHLIQAGMIEEAILIWHDHRQQETEQGQGQVAYAMWESLSSTRLDQTAKEYLHKIQSELATHFADHTAAQNALESIEWENRTMQIFADEQKAHMAKAESRFEEAKSSYRQALKKMEEIIESRLVYAHKDIARVYMHEQDLEKAWYEVQLAQYEAKNIQGDLRRRQGNLDEAIEHYLAAYTLAKELNYKMGQAKTANNLSIIYERQGKLDLARSYMERAVEHYERMGKITAIAGVKVNAATYYNRTGEYAQAIESASEASKIFARLLNERGQAMANQNLSESHLALGNLDQAESCSRAVIESEEITLLPDAYRVFGEIAAQHGDFATAEKFINDSIQLSQSNEDIWLEAYAHRALGKVYQLQQKSGQMDSALDKAIELFEELKLENEVAATAALRVHC